MTHPQNVSGQGQRDPLQVGKNAPDPEKFKKVLGVDKSSESDERGNRNSARQAEETEGEEEEEAVAPNKDLFSVLMSERSTKEINTGSSRQVTQDVSEPNPTAEEQAPIAPSDVDQTDKDSIRLSSKNNDKSFGEKPIESQATTEPGEKKITKKQKAPGADPFEKLDDIQSQVHELQPSAKKVKEHPTKKTPEEAAASIAVPHPTGAHHKGSDTPHKTKDQLPAEVTHKEPAVKPSFEVAQPAQTPPMVVEQATGPSLSSSPAYAQFSPQMFALFQKLVGMMTVMQFQGKTTTSITLNIPQSALNGAKIQIEHFDTAPHSFNIQFFGSPESQQIFSANLSGLEQQLKTTLPQFDIRVRTPLLLTEADESHEERKRRKTQVQQTPKNS
ncbi:MAG: hypothetical protein ACOYK9_03575 [Chlamydiia bacterium]